MLVTTTTIIDFRVKPVNAFSLSAAGRAFQLAWQGEAFTA